MSVELLQTLSIVSYVIAGVLLLLAIAMFFLLNIPKLYGDLTGKNARKAIESIRQQNEAATTARTDKSNSKNSPSHSKASDLSKPTTEKFSTSKLANSQETTILSEGSGETTVLAQSSAETTLLSAPASAETTLLSASALAETTLLSKQNTGETAQLDKNKVSSDIGPSVPVGVFNIVEELGFASSSEIIQ